MSEYSGKDGWYVGDPCYVISNSRWGEFCDLLFSNEGYHNNEASWIEWEKGGETYLIEVWDSPGGDGMWGFSCGKMGVDAGLLAVGPLECCDYKPNHMGILFEEHPDLKTDNHNYKVWLNDELDDSWEDCPTCGEEQSPDNIWDCDTCASTIGCESCWEGCPDCDKSDD